MIFSKGVSALVKLTPATLGVLFVLQSFALPASSSKALKSIDEPVALTIFLIGKSERFEKIKREYMRKLSSGGKALLLANRRDCEESLKQLNLCRRNDSPSADYIRGFCLEGLDRHQEAIAAYKRALAKVSLTFNPSSMFYLHAALPFFESGDYHSCLKYLAIAQKKAREENVGKTNPRLSVAFVSARVRALAQERMGQKKDAFESYVSFFGRWHHYAQLDQLLSPSPAAKVNAKNWLAANKLPPSAKPEEQAEFYLRSGRALLIGGNLSQARKALLKVLATGKPPLAVYDRRFKKQPIYLEWLVKGGAASQANAFFGLRDPFVRMKDAAGVLLIQTYLKDGNYTDACIAMRDRLLLQPENQRQIVTHAIRMKDVPEVVLQGDVDLHSEEVEQHLEGSPYLQMAYSMNKEILQAFQNLISGPQMIQAGKLVEEQRFADCLPVLDKLIKERRDLPPPPTIVEYQAMYQFGNLHRYVLELPRIAAAVAADRKNAALSFANFGSSDTKSKRIWQPVEDRLLGRPARLEDVDIEVRNVFPRMIEYESFASAVQLMKVGNFKGAAKEFSNAYALAKQNNDPDYAVFARSLKAFCEKR
jgi:tetratricopeptide (TPR) repeat protein